MIVFVEALIVLVIIAGVMALFIWSVAALMEEDYRDGIIRMGITFVVVAGVIAIAAGLMDDEHANQLCLSGHEAWATVHSKYGDTLEKQWVCTQWEQ